jgi:hypothetical protein
VDAGGPRSGSGGPPEPPVGAFRASFRRNLAEIWGFGGQKRLRNAREHNQETLGARRPRPPADRADVHGSRGHRRGQRARGCVRDRHRLRSDCILVFYMKKNLRACRFYYVNIFNLARAPKLLIRYLRCRTIPHCEMLDLASPRSNSTILSTSQQLESAKWSKFYCSFGKIKNPGTNVDFAFFKIVW